MVRKAALIAGFSLGVGLSAPSMADELAEAVDAIPPSVEDVRIGGAWQTGDEGGAYRILIAREGVDPITVRLFIQWIAFGPDGEATVAQSVEIKELAELEIDIVDYQTEADVDGLSVFLVTLDSNGDAGDTYELHLFSPTEYIFGPATN